MNYYKILKAVRKNKVVYAYLMSDGQTTTLIDQKHIFTLPSQTKILKGESLAFRMFSRLLIYPKKQYKKISTSQFQAQLNPNYTYLDLTNV